MIEVAKPVPVKVEEAPVLRWLVDCVRTILTTFYHMHRYAATGDVVTVFI